MQLNHSCMHSCPWQREWNLMISKVFPNPNHSMIGAFVYGNKQIYSLFFSVVSLVNPTIMNLLVMVVQVGAEVDHIIHQFHYLTITARSAFKDSNLTKHDQLSLRPNNEIQFLLMVVRQIYILSSPRYQDDMFCVRSSKDKEHLWFSVGFVTLLYIQSRSSLTYTISWSIQMIIPVFFNMITHSFCGLPINVPF